MMAEPCGEVMPHPSSSRGRPMPSNPRRSATIADAMVLVVATAAGLAAIRGMGVVWETAENLFASVSPLRRWAPLPRGFLMGLPCVATWTIALIVLRLRQDARGLGREPGFAA